MPEISVEVEILCDCGNGLCGQTRVSKNRGMPQIVIEPCEKCLEKARNLAFDGGLEEAYKQQEKQDGRTK